MFRNWCCALLILFLISHAISAQALHIVVDPGHGGLDAGAVRGNTKESQLVLEISQHLEKLLRQDDSFKVTMTRSEDKSLSLAERVKVANQQKADLFISLHANAVGDSRVKGMEFFFQNAVKASDSGAWITTENQVLYDETSEKDTLDLSKKSDLVAILGDLEKQHRIESSMKASEIFHNQMRTQQNSAIKQAPFFVISKTEMPSVLLELGFLSNAEEARKLKTPEYQREISHKIYLALKEYKEKVDKTSVRALK